MHGNFSLKTFHIASIWYGHTVTTYYSNEINFSKFDELKANLWKHEQQQNHKFFVNIPHTWNYWRVKYLAIRSKNAIGEIFAVLSTAWKETQHAGSLNGIHLIGQYLRDSLNHQIKTTAKYTVTYTVTAIASINLPKSYPTRIV